MHHLAALSVGESAGPTAPRLTGMDFGVGYFDT